MLRYYKIATWCVAPLVPFWLWLRKLRGKEDAGRMSERLGYSSYGRPKGKLLWIHAASVGEANSVLALIIALKKHFPALNILLTTGTVTSAALMKKRLPAGVLHHFAPVDTPEATERFVRHWLPDVVWFVESELWPNLIDAARRHFCLMALINARMSERSFYQWKKYPQLAKELLSTFEICFAQSEEDAVRLRALGAGEVWASGNLKYDALPLPCDEAALISLQKNLQGRCLWLAASTHPGEEALLAKAHLELRQLYPDLLLVIVPRHPERGPEIARELQAYGAVALRSKQEPIDSHSMFYIADTLGELGLFYRLSEIVFVGGSLVPHGGQNPWEAAQLSCAILCGPYMHNFADMLRDMVAQSAIMPVVGASQLPALLHSWFDDGQKRAQYQACAKKFVAQKSGSTKLIIDLFTPLFT